VTDVPKIAAPADVERMLEGKFAEAFAELGCFNLALFGKTGAGKSTLVNAVFGEDRAATGMGVPVTKGLVYHQHEDGFFGLYDSEGFETGTSGDAVLAGLRRIADQQGERPIAERIHAVWYVVRWSDRRFEASQAAFVRALTELGFPVIIVLTQVPNRDGQPHPEAVEFGAYIEGLGLPIFAVILTNALADPFTGSAPYGLQELLDITYQMAPEAARQALTAAQVIDLGRKKKAAAGIVRQSAAAAAVIGATPIPFADAALLVPTQLSMIARITAAYGLPTRASRSIAVAGSIVLTGGATIAGRYAATNIMKFVPGGVVVGSAISGTVAASLTKAIGAAWIEVCERAVRLPSGQRDDFLQPAALAETFSTLLKRGK
jgi:uncharacterized protein (DUF697 family)/GTP-binding protein EngB required for normal cell division